MGHTSKAQQMSYDREAARSHRKAITELKNRHWDEFTEIHNTIRKAAGLPPVHTPQAAKYLKTRQENNG